MAKIPECYITFAGNDNVISFKAQNETEARKKAAKVLGLKKSSDDDFRSKGVWHIKYDGRYIFSSEKKHAECPRNRTRRFHGRLRQFGGFRPLAVLTSAAA